MDSQFLSDLFQSIAAVALLLAVIGSCCTVVSGARTLKPPYGEMKMLAGLFFIAMSFGNVALALAAPPPPALRAASETQATPRDAPAPEITPGAAELFTDSATKADRGAGLPVLPARSRQYFDYLWALAHLAFGLCAMKFIDAFEHPERGWGSIWRHVEQAGETLRTYGAGKVAVREERRTRENWHACARAAAED